MKIRCYGGLFNNRLIDVGPVGPTELPPIGQDIPLVERPDIPVTASLAEMIAVANAPRDRPVARYGLAHIWYRTMFTGRRDQDESETWAYIPCNYLGDGQ